MMLVNIAKDDIKPLFINPSDVTALQIGADGTEISIYNAQGRALYAKLEDWNLDVADIVQKLEKNGVSLLPFTMRHQGKEYPHYIVPGAVSFATVSRPGKDGMVGAIIGVKGAGQLETWEGGTTQDEIDNLIAAARQAKTLFEYKPEEALSRWYEASALYIDPASVIRMKGSFDHDQIDVFFDNGGSLDVQVAYHNQFDLKSSFQQKARDIYDGKKYAGPLQGVDAIADIVEQLKREAFQERVDFVRKIVAANGNLLDISTETQAAVLRKDDIGTVSFSEGKNNGAHILYVRSKEKQGENSGGAFSLRFNTEAERETALTGLLQGSAPKAKSKPGPKP